MGSLFNLTFWIAATLWITGPLLGVTITEIHYHPAAGSESLEFIELHNELSDPVDITGYFLRGVDFVFEERTFLAPHAYLVVCADQEAVRGTYGIENTAGNWDPDTALANSGERIELFDSAGVIEASVRYNDKGRWPAGADGAGHSIELVDTYGPQDSAANWALSPGPGGSPGVGRPPTANPPGGIVNGEAIDGVRINEALLLGVDDRWIELYNVGNTAVDLSGFQFSVNRDPSTVATLPAGTLLPGRGFRSFTESTLGLPLRLDSDGEIYVVLSAPGGTHVIDARHFEPEIEGASEALFPDGTGALAPAAEPTPAQPNRVAVNRDVVLNEILYHPIDENSAAEFVELHNKGETDVPLDGWKFTDGIRFEFPPGASISAGGYLVVARDPAYIREVYGLAPATVLGPTDENALARFGVLADAGEKLTLKDGRGNVVDSVHYLDGGEWPHWADGDGSSLELADVEHDNSAPHAWFDSDDSDKAPVTEIAYSHVYQGPTVAADTEFHMILAEAGITVVDDVQVLETLESLEPERVVIDEGGTWRFFKGTEHPSDPVGAWSTPEFDDTPWLTGAGTIGFGFGDETTVIDDMVGNYRTIFLRGEFELSAVDAEKDLALTVEYDDAFAAWVNGTEVGSVNLRNDDRAFDARTGGQRNGTAQVLIPSSHLREGRNIVGVQVHNALVFSQDLRFRALLELGRITPGPANRLMDGDFETADEESAAWPTGSTNIAWRMEGTHIRSGRTTEAPLSGAGSLKIVATGSGDNKVNRIETVDDAMLVPSPGAELDIRLLARWTVGSPVLLTHGAYFGDDSPNYAHSSLLSVPRNLGTPGKRNSVIERLAPAGETANLGPRIDSVGHTPTVPSEGEAVTVRARVHDPDGVAHVHVVYTLESPLPPGDPGWSTVAMEGPDPEGVYRASLPGLPVQTRVVYSIVATDTGEREGRYPRGPNARTHPLLLDPENPVAEDFPYVVYRHEPPPDEDSGQYLSYRFWLHEAAEAYFTERRHQSNDLVEATFVLEEEKMIPGARLRFGGSPFARQGWPGSFRVVLPADNPLHLHGPRRKFNLENHQGNGGTDARERIAHYLIRHNQGGTRVPYSQQWMTEVYINDRVSRIYKEHVETPNREFLGRWYPDADDGDFFEIDDRHEINDAGSRAGGAEGRLRYPPWGAAENGDDPEEYRYYFNPRGRNFRDDFSNLISLARILTPSVTSNEEFDAQIWDHIDVEEFLRVWAVRLNTDDWDTWGARRGKNAYLYRPPDDGRWVLIPWDMEITFTDTSSFLPPALTADSNPDYNNQHSEVNRLLNRPPIKRLYYSILQEMTQGPFRSEFLTPYMDALETIGLKQTAVGRPNGFVDTRRRRLATAVEGVTAANVPLAFTTGEGGEFITETGDVVLAGVAPIEVRRVLLEARGDTHQATFSDTDLLGWQSALRLPEGTTEVTAVGFDGRDEAISTATLRVTVDPSGATMRFTRGDSDGNGRLDLIDALSTLRYLSDSGQLTCLEAADVDDNHSIELADVLRLVEYLFSRGAPPAAPFPGPGSDPTPQGSLGCAQGS